MTTEQRRHVVAAFESREHAERALDDLRAAGFRDDDIGWAMRHEEAPEGVENKADDAAGGAVTGAVAGGALGALGAAAAMALIPGIGPFIGGGILAPSSPAQAPAPRRAASWARSPASAYLKTRRASTTRSFAPAGRS